MNLDDKEASLIADLRTSLLTANTNGHSTADIDENKDMSDDNTAQTKKSKKRKLNGTNRKTKSSEASESRRESHKIIEQKRRQKINTKINELRELLNCPDSSQNKAVVLAAAVENIKNLKVVCSKLLAHHRQLQEEYMQVLQENEALKKLQEQQTHFSHTTPSDKNGSVLDPDRQLAMMATGTLPQPLKSFYGVENNSTAFRLPDISLPGSTNSGLGLLGNLASVGNLGSMGNGLYGEDSTLSLPGSNRTAQPLGVPGSEGYPLNSMVITDPLGILHQTYSGGEHPPKLKQDHHSIF